MMRYISDHARIYPPSTTKQRSSSIPCASLTVSLNYPLSTKQIYAAFANENILNYPLAECLDPYLICLDTTEHEYV